MNLKQRSNELELLDGDDIPFNDIKTNMQELDTINTLLGGHAITLKGFAQLAKHQKQIHVCEIGCGGGDNLIAIKKYCDKKGIQVQFTGIDIKQSCIDFATSRPALQGITTWIVNDYQQVQFTQLPDIIFSSLFCHHFTNHQLIAQLQWMQQHATRGFFINDLQRHTLAYYSIKWLTHFFSNSYLVKNDAPLSVARGFIRKEWQLLLQQAGPPKAEITWQWAFRYLIVYKHEY